MSIVTHDVLENFVICQGSAIVLDASQPESWSMMVSVVGDRNIVVTSFAATTDRSWLGFSNLLLLWSRLVIIRIIKFALGSLNLRLDLVIDLSDRFLVRVFLNLGLDPAVFVLDY